MKTAATAGTSVALRKTRHKLVGKIQRSRRSRAATGVGFLARVFRPDIPSSRFRELPWRFLRDDRGAPARSAGKAQDSSDLAFGVAHGCSAVLLRLAEELSTQADIECFVVLAQGGDLTDSFARLAPTLEIEWLVGHGISRHEVPRAIASAFHEYSSRGVAVCNTLAVSEFHAAFAEHGSKCSPGFTSFQLCRDARRAPFDGGNRAASRKIMVPSEAVRTALSSRFRIDPARIRTVYNGQDAKSDGLDRNALRARGAARAGAA